MRTKEITVGLSGTIPVASYENLKPHYGMTIELLEGESSDEAFAQARGILRKMFDDEANRAKTDLIEKQYAGIRFYEKDGKKYPSVTSILGWNTDWRITEDELQQYASRGTIVHTLVETYLKTGEWIDPKEVEKLNEDVTLVLSGSKKLHWDDCSYKKFFEHHKKDIEVEALELTVYNEEHMYAGTLDILGNFQKVRTVMDNKTGDTSDFRQLSAYAMCLPDIKQLAIFPLGKTDNKCGYMKPKICDTVQAEFKEFLKARAKFRMRFGI